MNLQEIRKKHNIIDLFIDLAEIPSPSLKEEKLSKFIQEIFSIHGIKSKLDKYGNIIAKIPATSTCKNVPPILLSAHMDVVGSSDEVNVRLSPCGQYIETDKKRTLGADNKAGIAAIMDVAISLNSLTSEAKHGPIEITFTRDEESGMTGIRNLDTTELASRYALICDGENLGEVDVEGAGFTNIFVHVHHGLGGHSGMNINDSSRVNAIKVLSEFDVQIPNGVYKSDESGVITSINAAVTIGGSASTFISEHSKNLYEQGKNRTKNPNTISERNMTYNLAKHSMLNIIPSEAAQAYSLRSSDPENEKELISKIKSIAKGLNDKYKGNIRIDIEVQKHLKPFVRSEDDTLLNLVLNAAESCNLKAKPSSFHAGAETHVLANEKLNKNGETFLPLITGIANLKDIHSSNEQLDWESLIKGCDWLKCIICNLAL